MSRSSYRYQNVAHRLRVLMDAGRLESGDRLPPERVLAREFRVSRNCVRQAIQTLQQEGRLLSRQGAGNFVADPAPESADKAIGRAIRAQHERLHEVIAFRRMLEPQIAALAAAHIRSAQLQRLKAIVCDQDRRQVAGMPACALDKAFHRLLAQATGNRVIQEVFTAIEEILDESRADSLQTDDRQRLSVLGHLKIIDALENRDGPAAAEAMDRHLEIVDHSLDIPEPAPPPETENSSSPETKS